MLILREEDGTISTSVYRVPPHTGQYLAFESHHPMAHKRAVVRTLMHLAKALCFSGVSRVQEALEKNGYLAAFVQRLSLPQPGLDEEEKAQTYVTIPCVQGLSQFICSGLDIRVTFRPFRVGACPFQGPCSKVA